MKSDPARPRSCALVNDQVVVEQTRRWISSFVIGLGLCPFARRVLDAGRIRSSVLAGPLHFIVIPGTLDDALLTRPCTRADVE